MGIGFVNEVGSISFPSEERQPESTETDITIRAGNDTNLVAVKNGNVIRIDVYYV